MKKVFTTFVLASLCLAAAAQDLTVTIDGKPVSNGDVITSNNVEMAESGGYIYSWDIKPVVHFFSEKGTDITVTVTNLGNGYAKYADGVSVIDPKVRYCGVKVIGGFPSGTCKNLGAGESDTQYQILPAGVTGIGQIYYESGNYNHPVPLEVKTSSLVKVLYGRETLEFTLIMEYSDPSGSVAVENIASEGADFTVVAGAVVADGEVEVYDLAGRRVQNDGLNGIYIIRIAGKTAKVVVK